MISLPSKPGAVVRIGGQCYEFLGTGHGTPSHQPGDVEDMFGTCEECAQGSSAEEVSSAQAVSSAIEVSSAQEVSSDSSQPVALAQCNCPSAGPKMNMTVSWGDADVTKDILGCSFTNGETKEVCPSTYSCFNPNPVTGNSGNEYWDVNAGGDRLFLKGRQGYSDSAHQLIYYCSLSVANLYRHATFSMGTGTTWAHEQFGSGNSAGLTAGVPTPYGIVLGGPNASGLTVPASMGPVGWIGDSLFGTITTSNDVTITWGRGAGAWAGCH